MKYVFVLCSESNYVKCPKYIVSASRLLRPMVIKHLVTDLTTDNVLMQYVEENDTSIETIDMHVMDEEMFKIYMEQFIITDTFYNYLQCKAINKLLICDREQITLKNINMLKHCKEVEFWQMNYNCLINETKKYMKRDITDKTYCRITNKEGVEVGKSDTTDYISHLEQWCEGIDLTTTKYHTFRSTEISKDIINEIICDDDVYGVEKYYLIMTMMMSKSHCHLIVNNEAILRHLRDIKYYDKYYHAFRYALSYAWISFYKEEQYKWRNMDITDECVFDIHTASLLPCMPTNYAVEGCGPSRAISPYMPLLYNTHYKNSQTINGIYKNLHLEHDYGVTPMPTFQKRLNLFVTSQNVNLFENVDWSNIGITGSVIACCLPNYNPLSHIVNGDYAEFAKLYYADSDLDIACNGTLEECYDTMLKLKQTLNANIDNNKDELIDFKEFEQNLTTYVYEENRTVHDSVEEEIVDDDYVVEPGNHKVRHTLQLNTSKDLVHVHPEKNANIYINKEFIVKYLLKFEEDEEKTDELIDSKFDAFRNDMYNVNNDEEHTIRDYMYDIYVGNHNGMHEFNKDYILLAIPAEKKNIRIFYSEGETEFYCINTIKYRFVSRYFRVPLELFKIRTKTIMGTVSQFHFPCVRAYYNGNNVHMTSSCIGTCHTLICNDYKFFAGVRDPVIIWLKYLKRGFSFTFNTNECKKFLGFMNHNKQYVHSLGFNEIPEYYLTWINVKTDLFGYNQLCKMPHDLSYENKINKLYCVKSNETIRKTIVDHTGNIIPASIAYISHLLLNNKTFKCK